MQQTPVPSAWGPSRARMLSLSHGPGLSLLFSSYSSPLHAPLGKNKGEENSPRYPTLCFLPSISLFFFCLHSVALGDRGRERKTEASVSSSLRCSGNNGPFYPSSEGPVGDGHAFVGGRVVCHGPSTLAWKQLTDVSVYRRTANAIVAATFTVLGISFLMDTRVVVRMCSHGQ